MTLNADKRFKRLRRAFAWILIFTLCVCTLAITAAACNTKKEIRPVETQPVATQAAPPEETVCETLPVLKEVPVLFPNIVYSISYNDKVSGELITTASVAVSELMAAIESGEYAAEASTAMLEELDRLNAVITNATTEQDTIDAWRSEYYYATETWLYLKRHGYNDAVASGIIGNMMIETSGGTMALNPTIYGGGRGYYGLCQWSLYYCPGVAGLSFEEQLDYLLDTITYEFNTFGGKCYKRGFTYEDFLVIEDPATAADAFAKIYERCGSGSYGLRKQAAVRVYEYFTLNTN